MACRLSFYFILSAKCIDIVISFKPRMELNNLSFKRFEERDNLRPLLCWKIEYPLAEFIVNFRLCPRHVFTRLADTTVDAFQTDVERKRRKRKQCHNPLDGVP